MDNLTSNELQSLVDMSDDIAVVRSAARLLLARSASNNNNNVATSSSASISSSGSQVAGPVEMLPQELVVASRLIVDEAYTRLQATVEEFNARPTPLHMTNVDRTEVIRDRTFYSDAYKRYCTFTERVVRLGLPHTMMVSHTTIDAIGNIIALNGPNMPGLRPYMISLNDHQSVRHFNAKHSEILEVLERLVEEYDGEFTIDSITVRFVVDRYEEVAELDIHANMGEGIPIKLPNRYWGVDLVATKKYCLLYAKLAWDLYVVGKLHADKGVYERDTQAIISKHNLRDVPLTAHRVCSMYKIPFKVIGSPEDVSMFTPQMTKDNMCLYVDCNHAMLIVHEEYLSRDMIKWLEYRSMATFTSLIREKKPKAWGDTHMLVADIESWRDKSSLPRIEHKPLVVGIYNGTQYTPFVGPECIAHMLDYVATTYEEVEIWMHNSGGYDSHLLMRELVALVNPLVATPIEVTDLNGALIKMRFEYRTSSITIKDSYRFFASPLSDVATSFSDEGKGSYDIVNASPEQIVSHEALDYNSRDCYVLHKALHTFKAEVVAKGWEDPLRFATLSSYVKYMFYTKYYDQVKYPLYVLPKWLHKKLEEGYRGGRNEVFQHGIIEGPTHIYDVNAMYPFVGCKELPYGKPVYVKHIPMEVTKVFLDNSYGFHVVDIVYTPIGIKPLHGVIVNQRYLFARFYDTKNVCLFSEELKYGLSLGYRYTLRESIYFHKAPYLKSMFTEAYDHRVSSESVAASKAWKLIANSSYGFFGFKKYGRPTLAVYGKEYEETLAHRHYLGQCIYEQVADDIYLAVENKNIFLKDTNVAVASAITSYGRIHLHQLICDVEVEGYKVCYCDTDSIFTNVDISTIPRLVEKYLKGGLGQLKKEHANKTITQVCIATAKVYGIKFLGDAHMVKMKGMNTSRQVHEDGTITTSGTSRPLYELMVESVLGDKPMTFLVSTILRSRGMKVAAESFLHEVIHTMTVRPEYKKGLILPNGEVIPYNIFNGVARF